VIAIVAFLLFAQATGTVTDSATHQPIVGAHVKAADNEDSVTGEDGGYSIAHPGAGEMQLRVEAKGYRSFETKALIAEGSFVKLDVELHPMARLKGKIVNEDSGKPVFGFLNLDKQGGRSYVGIANPKDGTYDIGGLEAGDYTLELRLRANRDFVYPGTIHVEEGQQQVLDIQLPTVATYRVKGMIEVPAGRESEALTIGIRSEDSNSMTGGDPNRPGPFSIEGLTPGRYTFTGTVGRGADKLYGELSLSVTDHDIDDVKIKLLPAASLTATIRMAEDGADVPEDAELTLFQADGRKGADPVSLHDGRFRIEGLPPGRYWAQLNHLPSGYAQTVIEVGLYGPTELPLIVTSKAGAILGTVRDEDQSPVKGAPVVLMGDSPMSKPMLSGTAGDFRFSDLAPGKYTVNGVPVEVGPGQTVTVTVHRVKT
jgi:Carboxypeptidase regulatory-like domain